MAHGHEHRDQSGPSTAPHGQRGAQLDFLGHAWLSASVEAHLNVATGQLSKAQEQYDKGE